MRTLTCRRDLLERKEWRAYWIHAGVQGQGPWYCFFRRDISIQKEIREAVIDVTADRHYRLYIDGCIVGKGPARSDHRFWSYDTYNVSRFLPRGAHTLGIIVSQWNPSAQKDLSLLCQLVVEYVDGTREQVLSDTSWKARVAVGWRHDSPAIIWIGPLENGFVEIRDLRADDMGWLMPDYDDSGWEDARLFVRDVNINAYPLMSIGRHWEYLVKRDIPHMTGRVLQPLSISCMGETRDDEIFCTRTSIGPHLWNGLQDLAPLRKCSIQNGETFISQDTPLRLEVLYEGDFFGRNIWQPGVVFDFGDLVNAHIVAVMEGPAGAIVDLSWAQTLQDGRVYPYTGGIYRVARFILDAGNCELETFEYVNCRYVQLTVRESASPVLLRRIGLRTVEYPAEQMGHFSCSDPLLERVWNATAKTTRLCMVDLFVDNTWREKNGWGGDISVAMLSALTCFGNLDVIKRYLRMFIYCQASHGAIPSIVPTVSQVTGIFDHAMAVPLRLRDYYRLTGDNSLVQELYAGVRRFMEYLERYENNNGLLDQVPGLVWFEWTALDRRMPSAILNFLYALVLEAAAELAGALACGADVSIYRAKIEALRSEIEGFWNEERGAFSDCKVAGQLSGSVSEAANGIALATGWFGGKKASSIVNYVFSRGFQPETKTDVIQSAPSFALYVLLGLCKAGRYDLALQYLRRRHGSAFSQGLDTMPEAWLFSSRGETSAAQGALPAAYVLSTEILGIKPGKPGFSDISLEPHPADLSWAQGAFPTPLGNVEMGWECGDSVFSVEVSVPSGARGKLRLPFRGDRCDVRTVSREGCAKIMKIGGRYSALFEPGAYVVKLAGAHYRDESV